jgi:hypothetical protein
MSAPWEAAGEPADAARAALSRLDDQIAWYDRKSQHSRRWFKRLKVSQIVTAAAIPVAAASSRPAVRHWHSPRAVARRAH